MTQASIQSNMAAAWQRQPEGVAAGTARTGVSAALWISTVETPLEVEAEPDAEHHIICVQLSPLQAEWVLDGSPRYNGRFNVGDVSIVPVALRPRAVMFGRFSCLHLYLPHALVSGIADVECSGASSGGLEILDPKRVPDRLILRIAGDVVTEMREKGRYSQLRLDALAQDLAIQLLRNYSNVAGSRLATEKVFGGGLAPWQVRRCKELMQELLAQDLTLAAMAAEVGLSQFHFARAFKQSMGIPPHAFQIRLRMERAQQLLLDTDCSVTEIAFDVGYESSQALARSFRKFAGCTPSDFRRAVRV